MIRRRVDTPPKRFADHPACRIFGEVRVWDERTGTVKVRHWYREDATPMETICDSAAVARAWMEGIREGELSNLELYWAQFPP